MTEPINLAALRMQTETTAATGQIATVPENLPDGRLADYLATIPARDLLALIDVAEAANRAQKHLRNAYHATPVRDDTRDTHYELEHARTVLSAPLARLDFENT